MLILFDNSQGKSFTLFSAVFSCLQRMCLFLKIHIDPWHAYTNTGLKTYKFSLTIIGP